MGALTFTCPTTGSTIDPKIETDQATFFSIRFLRIHLRCPHCDEEHSFQVAKADFAEAA
jgi:hypothetical protein